MTGALTQAEQTDVLLQGERVCKVFGPARARHQVLFDVDISVPAGQCVAIIGASGSGKSTLTRILLGLETPDGGDVRYRGTSIEGRAGAPQLRVLRDESGIVYQNPFESLDPRWTAFRSVAEPLRLRDRRASRKPQRQMKMWSCWCLAPELLMSLSSSCFSDFIEAVLAIQSIL